MPEGKDNHKLDLLVAERKRIENELAALGATKPEWPSVKLDVGYAAVDAHGNVTVNNQAYGLSVRLEPADAMRLADLIYEWLA